MIILGELNFRIVEGDNGHYEEKYGKFKDYYLNRLDLTIPEILKTLQITTNTYTKLLQRLYKETCLRRQGSVGGIVLVNETEVTSKYDTFKELYADVSIPVKQIIKDMGISHYAYYNYRKRFNEEFGLIRANGQPTHLKKI